MVFIKQAQRCLLAMHTIARGRCYKSSNHSTDGTCRSLSNVTPLCSQVLCVTLKVFIHLSEVPVDENLFGLRLSERNAHLNITAVINEDLTRRPAGHNNTRVSYYRRHYQHVSKFNLIWTELSAKSF